MEGHDGIFLTEEEYREFVRTEIVVNAATHRDYGIKGTDIQIKMSDDRLDVDSPGAFAGMVKKENIRYTHFSRNPKIAIVGATSTALFMIIFILNLYKLNRFIYSYQLPAFGK